MNKKILINLSVIGVVSAIAIGGTIAYFNDTETSTGNIFTAGSIDLKIDHLFQSYNGENCEEFCEISEEPKNIVLNGSFENPEVTHNKKWDIFKTGSTGLVWKVDWVGDTISYGGYDRPEPSLVEYHEGVLGSASEGDQYTELDSDWYGPDSSQSGEPASVRIWQDISTTPGSKYRVLFAFAPRPSTGSSENQLKFSWDGSIKDTLTGLAGGGAINWSEKSYDVVASSDTTRIEFADAGIENSLGTFLDDVRVYELECDYTLPGAESCEIWEETDLENQKFFNFTDVKPGDFGRNVISLHVFDNDAWACLIADNFIDDENELMEPEVDYGDNTVGSSGGELSDYLTVYIWHDDDGDGVPDAGEIKVGESLIRDLGNLGIFDSSNQEYVTATTTKYVGFAWCAGDIEYHEQTESFSCDGSTMKDDAQSDIFSADLIAYAEQVRNNSSFICSPRLLDECQNDEDCEVGSECIEGECNKYPM